MVVGATLRQINRPQLHSHTSGDLHGGVSELMATYVVRSCRSAAWSSRRSSDLAMNKSISVSSPMRCSTLWSVRDLDGSVSKRGWCGGGIFPVVDLCSGASSLRRRFLQRRSGAREVTRSTRRLLFAHVIAGRWCILCWFCGWRLTVLVSSSDVVVVRGCQFWSLMACPGTCCPGLIRSTAMVLLRQTTLQVRKAVDQRWSRVELECRGDLSSVPLVVASVVSKEEDRRWFFA